MDNASHHSVCPPISDTTVLETLLKKSYGLTVVSLKPLKGYEDLNFHVKVETNQYNNHIKQVCPHGYLVKVINANDSRDKNFAMGQKLLMDCLNDNGLKSQSEVMNIEGQFFSSIKLDTDGEVTTHLVSVRTYIPGILLNDVSLTPALAYDVGVLTAKVTKALQDFHFPFYETFATLWSMDNLLKVKEAIHAVKDDKQGQVAKDVITQFEKEVMSRRKEFKRGQVHGDINEQNILVQKTASGVEISGLIDFQDTGLSYPIYDLGIVIAYMMMVKNSNVPVMDVGGHVLAGYETVWTLNKAERRALRTVVAGRMTMSLVYGAYSYMQNPENDYVLTTSLAGWKNLLQFWQETEETVRKRWNEILKSYSE